MTSPPQKTLGTASLKGISLVDSILHVPCQLVAEGIKCFLWASLGRRLWKLTLGFLSGHCPIHIFSLLFLVCVLSLYRIVAVGKLYAKSHESSS